MTKIPVLYCENIQVFKNNHFASCINGDFMMDEYNVGIPHKMFCFLSNNVRSVYFVTKDYAFRNGAPVYRA